MKLHKICFLFVIVLSFFPKFIPPASAGQAPGTGALGSVHDLNMFSFVLKDQYQRACAFCHTPHNANPGGMGMLWVRTDSGSSGLEPYTWSVPANKDIPQDLDPLVGPSRLCMTCHDGAIALDAHGSTLPQQKVISKDLDKTHPIGFSYDKAAAVRGNRELADKTLSFATGIAVSNVPGEQNAMIRNGKYRIVDVLYNGSVMTCSTCHDVHNKNNVSPDAGHDYNYLLWAKEEQSLLCLSCHIK